MVFVRDVFTWEPPTPSLAHPQPILTADFSIILCPQVKRARGYMADISTGLSCCFPNVQEVDFGVKYSPACALGEEACVSRVGVRDGRGYFSLGTSWSG